MTTGDVVGGPSPISFTGSNGSQRVVPLSALSFSGSSVEVSSGWTSEFDSSETAILLALAADLFAIGELTPPPSPPPQAAVAVTATHTGPLTNGITVTVSAPTGQSPLTTPITVSAVEVDTWSDLGSGTAAAMTIGVDAPTGKQGDAPAGTGLIVVKQGSTGGSSELPVAAISTVLKAGVGVDLVDSSNAKVCTILPRADYSGTGGLSYTVTIDASGKTFTLTATYDSTKETGTQGTITLQTLTKLPTQVGYLVGVTPPASGAALPGDGSVQLSGGTTGIAASGMFYT